MCMKNSTEIQLFDAKQVRTAWNMDEEEWYFSVVDVVGVLTDSIDGRKQSGFGKLQFPQKLYPKIR